MLEGREVSWIWSLVQYPLMGRLSEDPGSAAPEEGAGLQLLPEGLSYRTDCTLKELSTASEIEPGVSRRPEPSSVRQEKTGFRFEELGWLINPGRAEVKPGQIRGLNVRNDHIAEFLAAEFREEITVGP